MVIGSTPTIIDSFLKDNYDSEETPRAVNEDHTFLDMLDTKTRGTGRQWIFPVLDANAQGFGGSLPDAQAGAEQTGGGGNYQGADWNVPWGDYFAAVNIGDKAMAVSASDMGAFLEDKKEEIDSLHRGWGDIFSSYLLRDSGHALGVGTIASGVITLTTKSDIVNFERGMIIVPSANDGTSSAHVLIASAGLGYVVKTNYNTGVLTVSATSGGSAGTPANWTGTMNFFRSGDFGGDVSPNVILSGFGTWNPAADPGATLFCGVDRSLDIVRRSGIRLVAADVAGLGLEKRIKKLAVTMSSRAKAMKKLFVHDEQWQALADSLDAKGVRNIEAEKGAEFNWDKITLRTPKGSVGVFSDKFMPRDVAYGFDPSCIRFRHVDGFPKVINEDGFQMIRRATSNAYEFRLASYPAYAHRNPWGTGRVPLAAL